ncbi:hypothetical protein ACOSQ2_010059 [Xanthoceras sorbifolium]
MTGKGVQLFDNWKLSVLFPWNRQRHTLISNEELMIAFEAFDKYDSDEDDSYEVGKETGEDSEVSLDEGLCEEGADFFCSDPDGDSIIFQGSIELKEGQVFGNAKLTRAVVKGYAIYEGFRLKKIKNDSYRYTVTCKNDACDWRLHASSPPDGLTYMIKSMRGSHSFCQRMVENKEANSRWVATVLQTTIQSNPTIELWHTSRVGSAADFKEALKWVEENSVDAVNWLMSEPVEKWARYAFNYRIKSDHVTNNMFESFNKWIKDERDKPILTLLELLRRKIMVRFSKKWDELEKWNDFITLYAREHWMMNEKEARKLEVIHGRGEWYKTLEPSMKLTYSGSINPIPDESRWPEIEHNDGNANEVVEPPQKRTKVGRPKKARRRAADEPRQGNAKGKGKGPSLKGKKKAMHLNNNHKLYTYPVFPSLHQHMYLIPLYPSRNIFSFKYH